MATMRMEKRSEYEIIADRILHAIERARPSLAKSLNAKLDEYGAGDCDGFERKIAKIMIVKKEQARFFATIFRSVLGERSPANCFDLLDNYAGDRLNPFGELTGGNFRNI